MSIEMKRFATAAAFAVVVAMVAMMAVGAQAAASDMANEASYQAWCTKYDKSFCLSSGSSSNLGRRSDNYVRGFDAFQRQVAKIERHNADPNSTYVMGLTEHFDVNTVYSTRQEGGNPVMQPAGVYGTGIPVGENCLYNGFSVVTPPITATATSLDNTASIGTAVFNQGSCQCCSAVVARDMLSHKFGSVVSMNQLMNCADNGYNSAYHTYGCYGGYTAAYIKYNNDHGCQSDTTYPWGSTPYCVTGKTGFSATVGAVVSVGVVVGERNFASGVRSYGVLGVMIVADSNFAAYTSGVFNTNNAGTDANHALLLVGYNGLVTVQAVAAKRAGGGGGGGTPAVTYHICRNSWGAWGINGQGIVWIKSGVNMCGISNFGALAVY